ncbi:fungal specific transcription factor [Fonsecaea pedrosoi]|nr:fungal specific transcription factor [Fonsecaea pedrosoi]
MPRMPSSSNATRPVKSIAARNLTDSQQSSTTQNSSPGTTLVANTYTPLADSQEDVLQNFLLSGCAQDMDVADAELLNCSDAGHNEDVDTLGLWLEMTGSDIDIEPDKSTSVLAPLSIDALSKAIAPGPFSEQFETLPGLGGAKIPGARNEQSSNRRSNESSASHVVSAGGLPDTIRDSQRIENDATEQLISRFGRLRLAEDGLRRYYGATSNLHLTQNPLVYCFQPNIRTIASHGETDLARAGLQWKSDPTYEEHLTKLFFAWHNSLLNIVNETMYYHHRALYRAGVPTAYFSPTLENAVLAVGASYSSQRLPGVDDPPEFFAYRAKTLLEIEMDSPCMATVQALGTLSAHEAAYARDSRGWLYLGMAVQLLSDLGLHLDLDATFDSKKESEEHTNLRRTIFWSTQALDTLWSVYSGRPCSMRYEDVSVPVPQPVTTAPWKPYMDHNGVLNLDKSLDPSAVGETHLYLVQLCSKIRKMSKILYSGLHTTLTDTTFFFVDNMTRELQSWHQSLPEKLKIDPSFDKNKPTLPAVLVLHMQFHEVMIMLRRPFISPSVPNTSHDGMLKDSAEICEASATAICRLLVMYRHQWGMRFMHPQIVSIILTAAMIHVHNCCIYSRDKGMQAHENISLCYSALGEMSYFNIATRSLETIMSLRRDWQSRTFTGIGKKRPGHDIRCGG